MKGTWFIPMAILALILALIFAKPGLAVDKSLADILKEKGVLTEEEYEEAVKVEAAQRAEEAKKAAAATEKPSGLPLAGYSKGFFLQALDGKYRLVLNGYVRTQLRLYENNTSQDNEFKIRDARLSLKGYYGKYWNSDLEGEFSTPSEGKFLKNAYVNCSYFPDLQVQIGQFKAPFSREFLTSNADIDTIERAMITESGGLTPKYDIGIMLWGPKVFDGLLWYGVGAFNGNGANNSDTNDDKDLIARLALSPFAPTYISFMKGLEIGGSFQIGRETPDQKFQPKLATDWPFFKEIKYRGMRERYGFDMTYKLGPFKLQAEWIYQTLEREKQVRVDPSTNEIVGSGGKLIDAPDLNAWGWYILGTYFIWGNEDEGIQLVARYEQMDVDDDKAKDKYLDANPKGKNSISNPWGNDLNLRGNTANVLTLGFNYFPIRNVKLAFNWYYQTLDNKFTTDKIRHNHDGNEYFTGGGGAMNAFWFLAQAKW